MTKFVSTKSTSITGEQLSHLASMNLGPEGARRAEVGTKPGKAWSDLTKAVEAVNESVRNVNNAFRKIEEANSGHAALWAGLAAGTLASIPAMLYLRRKLRSKVSNKINERPDSNGGQKMGSFVDQLFSGVTATDIETLGEAEKIASVLESHGIDIDALTDEEIKLAQEAITQEEGSEEKKPEKGSKESELDVDPQKIAEAVFLGRVVAQAAHDYSKKLAMMDLPEWEQVKVAALEAIDELATIKAAQLLEEYED